MKTSNIKNSIKNFHNDEAGLEAIQVVMILAIAAVALILIKSKWGDISSFFNDNVGEATEW